jgi:molybdopterin converting factor small subunit
VLVEVGAFATLRRFFPELGPGETKFIEVAPGTTLEEIRDLLGLPPEEVKLVMRNHLQADLNEVAQDGDRVVFLPAVAGG